MPGERRGELPAVDGSSSSALQIYGKEIEHWSMTLLTLFAIREAGLFFSLMML
jgi:hypothetical protein